MDQLEPRVRAVCDLNVAEAREYGGRHEYDGLPQDLSPDGVAAGLSRLAAAREGGAAQDDPHDEAQLRAFEDLQRVAYGELQLHRRNPLYHLGELDLASYDKDYAPQAERHAARRRPPGRLARGDRRGGQPRSSWYRPGRRLTARRRSAASPPGSRPTPTRAPGTRPCPRTSAWSRTSRRPRSPGRRTRRSARAR